MSLSDIPCSSAQRSPLHTALSFYLILSARPPDLLRSETHKTNNVWRKSTDTKTVHLSKTFYPLRIEALNICTASQLYLQFFFFTLDQFDRQIALWSRLLTKFVLYQAKLTEQRFIPFTQLCLYKHQHNITMTDSNPVISLIEKYHYCVLSFIQAFSETLYNKWIENRSIVQININIFKQSKCNSSSIWNA